MLNRTTKGLAVAVLAIVSANTYAQTIGGGSIHGNFQVDMQYYRKDTAIGAPIIKDKTRMNAWGNIVYNNENFTAGIRYENYTNAINGYPVGYSGQSGIPIRFATYNNQEGFEITAGNYYDQFGNGLIFRSYVEPNLGYDNAMDGVRIKYSAIKGLYLKGVYGKQRRYWTSGSGIVRGGDAELQLNEALPWLNGKKTIITVGASAVSKYQEDTDPIYKTPENVGAGAGRINISRNGFNVNGEYAYKANDPSGVNGYTYNYGDALLISTGYSQKGFGAVITGKRLNNMDFRSDRTAQGQDLSINFLPPIAKYQTYQLATIYPFATQPLGEMGLQGEVYYFFKPGTMLGGTYGTNISVNTCTVNNIDTVKEVNPRKGYTTNLFGFGKEQYYRDFNVEISKKITKDLKVVLTYVNMMHNIITIPRVTGFTGPVHTNMVVADITYKLNATKTVRTELQSLTTKEDQGDWGMAMVEYTIPGWFFAVSDLYNYGNPVVSQQLHYYNLATGYTKGATRIALSYGRQRAGLLCIGGVCRQVPAANGVTLSVSTSF